MKITRSNMSALSYQSKVVIMLASIKEIRKLGDISTFIPNHWEIELGKGIYNWIILS